MLEKMNCRILLLITVSFGVCAKRSNHLHYQAEENSNVTVEWRFSHQSKISVPKIHCVLESDLKVFFLLDDTVVESQHEQFAGRVQCDTSALRSGLVRLHVARVRTNDSGLYHCRMATEFGKRVQRFSLNVTAASHEPKLVMPKPQQASRHSISLYVGLALALVLAAAAAAARGCV